jgi:hypothetical protein
MSYQDFTSRCAAAFGGGALQASLFADGLQEVA